MGRPPDDHPGPVYTPHPAGYLLDVDWTADMKAAGYVQRQCSGCGRWLIWEAGDGS